MSALELPKLIVPGTDLVLDLSSLRPTDYLRSRMILADDHSDVGEAYRSLLMSGKSNYASNKVLNHAFGKTAWTMPTNLYVALATTLPTAATTGTTIVEANYTGYVRLKLETSVIAESTAQKSTTNAKVEFAACTSGSSTVVGFGLIDASTVGNAVYWGSTTSTVISTTQTPATIASGALEASES